MDPIILLIVILLLLWLFGAFVRPFGGSLIHILLVIVLILVILRLV
ncbi:MAG: lmo0937 family membrane protein [Gemmatimonadetes bacterium]|nr:lmo0937 family membrane protein [Gemmatimonadota bacterium]